MDISRTTQVVSAIAHTAYGIGMKDSDNHFKSPFAFDSYDLWFGEDFNFLLSNIMDDLLSDIETDISSVDSSNLSEQHSEQRSQQSSADNQARFDAGLTSSLATSVMSGLESSRVSTLPSDPATTQPSSSSVDDVTTSGTPSHAHSNNGGYHDPNSESTFSGVSWSDYGDEEYTGLSDSEGTSQDTGEASTISSVSIYVQEYEDFWKNENDGAAVTILMQDSDDDSHHGSSTEEDHGFGGLGGLEWIGDNDNENIFGTGWMDEMFGGSGNDEIRGLGGNDYITGGDGVDRIWADAGNDIIYTSYGDDEDLFEDDTVGDGDFASGGSGDDKIYGSTNGWKENLFGGAGNDYLQGNGGDDYLHGGSGHDEIEGGAGNDDIKGGDGDDQIDAGYGNDDVEAGDGDDYVYGDMGNDDIHGNDGDDELHGGYGNDDVWGGKGNDLISGGHGDNVLRGEDGDDIILMGLDIMGFDNMSPMFGHAYGGSGEDAIFGVSRTKNEFIWGGEGNDYIRGGDYGQESTIFGNDGDDFIRPGSGIRSETIVEGGKGDDTINQVDWDEENAQFLTYSHYYQDPEDYGVYRNEHGVEVTDADGNVLSRNEVGYGSSRHSGNVEFKGEQGDDEIWGASQVMGHSKIDGGSGDDKLYLGTVVQGYGYVYGGSGKDLIRNDWYQQYDPMFPAAFNSIYIYGDYKYGEDALDKDLWGDADVIYAGNDITGSQEMKVSAGDGDDIIHGGQGWDYSYLKGENGDDTIYLPQGATYVYGYGNDGDDEMRRTASYGEVTTESSENYGEYLFGGAGNDIIEGTHAATGWQYLYGGDGNDKLYGGDYIQDNGSSIAGGDGDDWIEAGDNTVEEWLYGDSADFYDDWDYKVEYGDADSRYVTNDRGDDVIYGGDNVTGTSYIHGGYGDDKLIGGSNVTGDYVVIYGDNGKEVFDNLQDHPASDLGKYEINRRGRPDDGDDLIDLGDSPDVESNYAYGQGGNDKIIGGAAEQQYLYGGLGDDKLWSMNPGQLHPAGQKSNLFGGDGKDIIYGAPQGLDESGAEYLYGDHYPSDPDGNYGVDGDDDIIYTGDSPAHTDSSIDGDTVFGGAGNDRVYGQGFAPHTLYGNRGDDYMVGGKGDDFMYGDDNTTDGDGHIPTTGAPFDASKESGDDTMHGEEGDDFMYAGPGDDYVYGDEGADTLYGSYGDDTLWGGDGSDYIYTGTGWDTVFGGDGCDKIFSNDGADVIWAGDCDPSAEEEENEHQTIQIFGTGPDPDNFTVIMDFWHESAMPWNILCLYPDARQGIPSSGECSINVNYELPYRFDPSTALSCLTATDIMSGRAPEASGDITRVRGSGCKNDGGPLWVTVELVDSADDLTNYEGGGDDYRTLFGRIFQKKQAKSSRRRSRRSRYAQVAEYGPTETKSDLEECMALQLCTTTGGDFGFGPPGINLVAF